MNGIWRKFNTAWGLSFREKLWLVLLYPLSGFFRLCTLVIPFRWVAGFLGECQKGESVSRGATQEQEELAWRIGRMCALAARYTPWESKCLVQALMARCLLGCYGVPYVIRLGVGKGEEASEGIKAHAWTQVGRLVVTGRKGHLAFQVLNAYASGK